MAGIGDIMGAAGSGAAGGAGAGPWGAIAGAGAGVLNGLIGLFSGAKQKRAANAIHPDNPVYNINPIERAKYGTASNLMQGEMAGGGALRQGLFANEQNALTNVFRNSSDGATNLALAGAIQGQTDQSLQDLQTKELQNKQNQYGNYANAADSLTNEGDKVYNDRVRTFNQQTAQKAALQQAGYTNQTNGLNTLGTTGMLMGQGAFGNFNFGGGSNLNPNTTAQNNVPFMNGANPLSGGSFINPYPNPGGNYINPIR